MLLQIADIGANTDGQKDRLSDAGHALLQFADYRYLAIATLVLIALFCGVKRVNSGSWPTPWECIKVGFSFLAVLGAITFFAVFFMTKPPDCHELSSGDVQLVGIAVVVVAVGSDIGELRSSFSRGRVVALAPPDPTTPPIGGDAEPAQRNLTPARPRKR